jgi:hypothetical protein
MPEKSKHPKDKRKIKKKAEEPKKPDVPEKADEENNLVLKSHILPEPGNSGGP